MGFEGRFVGMGLPNPGGGTNPGGGAVNPGGGRKPGGGRNPGGGRKLGGGWAKLGGAKPANAPGGGYGIPGGSMTPGGGAGILLFIQCLLFIVDICFTSTIGMGMKETTYPGGNPNGEAGNPNAGGIPNGGGTKG